MLRFNKDYTLLVIGSDRGVIKIWRIGDRLVGPSCQL